MLYFKKNWHRLYFYLPITFGLYACAPLPVIPPPTTNTNSNAANPSVTTNKTSGKNNILANTKNNSNSKGGLNSKNKNNASQSNAIDSNNKNESSSSGTMDDTTKTGVITGVGTGLATMLYCTAVLNKDPTTCLVLSAAIGTATGVIAKKIDENMANSIQRIDCKGSMKKLRVNQKNPPKYQISIEPAIKNKTIYKPDENISIAPFYYIVADGNVKIKISITINGNAIDLERVHERQCGGYKVPIYEINNIFVRDGRNDIKMELLDATKPQRTAIAESAICLSATSNGINACK